jgi:hypothetical protein
MMALELLDTKWAGVIQRRPGSGPAGVSRPGGWLSIGRRLQLGEVMMLDTWLRTVLGRDPQAPRDPSVCRAAAKQP